MGWGAMICGGDGSVEVVRSRALEVMVVEIVGVVY